MFLFSLQVIRSNTRLLDNNFFMAVLGGLADIGVRKLGFKSVGRYYCNRHTGIGFLISSFVVCKVD